MPRKGPVTKRDVLPDPVYGSKLLTRFINKIMLDGKKGVAERIVYDAFDLVRAKTGKDPLEVFDAAMQNVMPLLEVRARRVGGANYQVPVEVRADRKTTLGIRWLVNYSRLRGERTMCERVAGEIMAFLFQIEIDYLISVMICRMDISMPMLKLLQRRLQNLSKNLFPIISLENGDWRITLQVCRFLTQLLNVLSKKAY